jgi:hypothetical protein
MQLRGRGIRTARTGGGQAEGADRHAMWLGLAWPIERMRAVVTLRKSGFSAEVGPLAVMEAMMDNTAARTRVTWIKYAGKQTNPLNRVLSPNGPVGGEELIRSKRREMNCPIGSMFHYERVGVWPLESGRLPSSSRLRSDDNSASVNIATKASRRATTRRACGSVETDATPRPSQSRHYALRFGPLWPSSVNVGVPFCANRSVS